jgi:hypothetical protein
MILWLVLAREDLAPCACRLKRKGYGNQGVPCEPIQDAATNLETPRQGHGDRSIIPYTIHGLHGSMHAAATDARWPGVRSRTRVSTYTAGQLRRGHEHARVTSLVALVLFMRPPASRFVTKERDWAASSVAIPWRQELLRCCW